MYFSVKEVKPQDNYILLLIFEDGAKREFDMKPYLGTGIFQELKDINLFKTVKTSFDTIEWDNEADFDPEILYQKSREVE
jgi:hypothetical protein